MLTNIEEHGKQKCTHYWPTEIQENEAQQGYLFDNNKEVRLVSVESLMPNLIKRKFLIKAKGRAESQVVIHLQNLSWPDHGTPEEEDCAILKTTLEYIREHH